MAGSYCTYAVKCDGSVTSCGEGSFGRLGHGDSESETSMRNISALQGNVPYRGKFLLVLNFRYFRSYNELTESLICLTRA